MRHIKKYILSLLAMVWFFSITSCRHFGDCRTSYKSFVTITYHPIEKDDELVVHTVTNKATNEKLELSVNKLPLNCHADTVQFIICSSSPTSPNTLTITYQKKAVLISHQCGCAYKYKLEKVTSTGAGKCKIINKELSTLNESDIDVQIYL